MLYYMEMLGAFVLFMFLGLMFSPFLGGCFMLMIILFLLGGFIIFFSINFIWFLIAGLAFYLCGWIIKFYRWYQLPDMHKYLQNNSQCRLSQGVSCRNCNSDNIKHIGLFNQNSRWRYYTCNSCGHTLYRFTVL